MTNLPCSSLPHPRVTKEKPPEPSPKRKASVWDELNMVQSLDRHCDVHSHDGRRGASADANDGYDVSASVESV